MGAADVLSRKAGVIVGDDVMALFKYAQEKGFAIPAIVGPPAAVYGNIVVLGTWAGLELT